MNEEEWLMDENSTCWKYVYGGLPPLSARSAVSCARTLLYLLVQGFPSDYASAICPAANELRQICPYDWVTGVGVGPAWAPFSDYLAPNSSAKETIELVLFWTGHLGPTFNMFVRVPVTINSSHPAVVLGAKRYRELVQTATMLEWKGYVPGEPVLQKQPWEVEFKDFVSQSAVEDSALKLADKAYQP
jgi:hypothetical protein